MSTKDPDLSQDGKMTDDDLMAMAMAEEGVDAPDDPPEAEAQDEEQEDAVQAALADETDDEPPSEAEPDPKKGSEAKAEDDEPDEPKSEPKDDPKDGDWRAALPEDARRHLDKLNEKLTREQNAKNAMTGMIAPVQRENAALKKQIARLEEAVAGIKGADNLEDMPKWQKYQEEFPDEAEALKQRFDAQERELAAMKATLARVEGGFEEQSLTQQEQYKQQQIAALEERFPGGLERARSDEFKEWLVTQPEEIQGLYGSLSASDYGKLLILYEAETGVEPLRSKAPADTTATTEEDAAEQAKLRQTKQRRAAARADASPQGDTPTRLTPNRTERGELDDEDVLADTLLREHPDLADAGKEMGLR